MKRTSLAKIFFSYGLLSFQFKNLSTFNIRGNFHNRHKVLITEGQLIILRQRDNSALQLQFIDLIWESLF
jgi:hypothetical protein